MSAPVTCKHCPWYSDATGTVNGHDAAVWEYLGHLQEEHGEK